MKNALGQCWPRVGFGCVFVLVFALEFGRPRDSFLSPRFVPPFRIQQVRLGKCVCKLHATFFSSDDFHSLWQFCGKSTQRWYPAAPWWNNPKKIKPDFQRAFILQSLHYTVTRRNSTFLGPGVQNCTECRWGSIQQLRNPSQLQVIWF